MCLYINITLGNEHLNISTNSSNKSSQTWSGRVMEAAWSPKTPGYVAYE
jgi:hypothetical protein